MAHESFEDDEAAKVINDNFIPIKVDKEERPDIDSIYMKVCMAMTGSGGWPLTIIMTPDKKPFYAGTYLPKHSYFNMSGVIELLTEIKDKWKSDKKNIDKMANEITDFIKQPDRVSKSAASAESMIKTAFKRMEQNFDKDFGGFGNAPKFPMPHGMLYLLEYYKVTNDEKALEMTEKTLTQMYRGGIFDHIGFGFSRYSTDYKWLVPHFEKMLYDNALLILAYTNAYELTKNKLYQDVASKTIQYVLRELTGPDGGFYCAQDADSDGVEGKYYVFEPDEIKTVLGEKDADHFNNLFDITSKGNFEGKNIPNLIAAGITGEKPDQYLHRLYEYRKNRNQLHLDDKILTSWNGLMIAALARAYAVFKEEPYLSAAKRAALLIKEKLTEGDKVFASYRDGSRSETGFIDDYGFYTFALIELYKVTLDKQYLSQADRLTHKAIEEFYDHEQGGFFLYGKSGEQLLIKPKETYDGAIPSGNSVFSYNLFVLSKLLKSDELEEYATKQREFMLAEARHSPDNYSFFMMVLLLHISSPKEIICVLKDKNEFDSILKKMLGDSLITILESETEAYKLKDDKTTFYVCENNMCLPPANDI